MTGKELKNSILQLAISGKLVPQDPTDEPASVLLKRIRKEKEQLVKEGKLKKKDLVSEPIGDDEKAFEIPESWEWVRLKEIFSMQAGKAISASQLSSEKSNSHQFPCYGGNGLRGFIGSSNNSGIHCIVGRQGALCGNINLTVNSDFYATEHAVVVSHGNNVDVYWAYYFLIALDLNQYATATAQPGLSVAKVIETLIPLPPLAEQRRIVAKIEELMPLIDEYDKAQAELDKLNTTLPEALKKSILQQAICGKLVPQDPTDEPASELLKRIRKEKEQLVKQGKLKKKDLDTTPITDDEKPYEIPNSWSWCHICDISYQVGSRDNQILAKSILKDGGIPVVSQGQSLIDGFTNESIPVINDLPIVLFGDHTRNVKFIDFPFVIGADGTKLLRPLSINAKYFFYWMMYVASGLRNRGYARHYILLKYVPLSLPPLSEQHRIVAKIEQLFALIDK